ncbi:iron transporter [Geovibrio thiophilus]|uniref:Iron transporter n=1 Tax=Geovibrio thiophilus TaxID=139438 RepID=A0A410JZK2_9BACT|nr:iron transporter [Geovibrio thiophilus]QAR33448.1 iron transporter [Geovibrio thiophilus]
MFNYSAKTVYRLDVASRTVLAVFGGYWGCAAFTVLFTRLLPFDAKSAALTANMIFFLIYTCVFIWVFSVKKPLTAWLGVGIPSAVCGFALFLWGAA